MKEEKSYIGYWWLPDKEDEKISGTLTLLQNGDYILQVLEEFSDLSLRFKNDIELIIGIAREVGSSKDFSFKLIKSFTINNSINVLTYYKLAVSWVLKSSKLDKSSNLKFNVLKIVPQNLDTWFGINVFETNFLNSNDEDKFPLKFNKQEGVLLYKSEDFTIEVHLGYSYGFLKRTDFIAQQEAFIKIKFTESKEIIKLMEFSDKLRNFFSLAIGNPIKLKDFIVVNDAESKNAANYYFYFKDSFRSNFNDSLSVNNQRQMLFGYDLIKKDTQEILRNWFKKYDKLKFTINNYFNSIYNDSHYTEDKFLNYVFAIEVYHRNQYDDFELRDENYLSFRKTILSKIDNTSQKQWLIARLNKYKENKLNNRLTYILDILKKCIEGLIDDNETFINQVVETRHYYVHENVRNQDIVIKEEEILLNINEKLKIILQALMLKEIGFEDEVIAKLLQNPLYNRMAFDDK